jgi:hypothetical protein
MLKLFALAAIILATVGESLMAYHPIIAKILVILAVISAGMTIYYAKAITKWWVITIIIIAMLLFLYPLIA